MKRTTLLGASALLCLLAVSCKKKEETTGSASPTQVLPAKFANALVSKEALSVYGFAGQVPKEAEGYVSLYDGKKLCSDFLASKAVVALLANPVVKQALANPSMTSALAQMRSGEHPVIPLLGAFFGQESFVFLAPGSAQRLMGLQQLQREKQAADIETLLAGKGFPAQQQRNNAYFKLLQEHGDLLQIPPMVIGGKVGSQKAAFGQQLAALEKQLPAGVEIGSFDLSGNPGFKSLVFNASKLVPAPQQENLKKAIAANIQDAKAAEDICKSLLNRKVEIAYGFAGDYLLISIGDDHSHLKLAPSFSESLLARPELAVAAQYAKKPLVSLSWSDQAICALGLPNYKVSAFYGKLRPQIEAAVPGLDSKKLGEDLARLDDKGTKIFPSAADAMVAITFRDHGLCSETFGGIKPFGFIGAHALKFSAAPTESTFFWLDAQRDPAAAAATWDYAEDLVSTGYNWFVNYGVPKLPDQQRMGFGMFQNVALPKLVEFYKITKDQYAKSLGNEGALVVDLGGEMPQVPMLPPDLLAKGKAPRLGIMREVQDRKLLAQSWDSYFKMARDIAMMVPQTAQMPGGLPGPKQETTDGITLSYYPLPMPLGDLLPTVATTDHTLVMSTSQKLSIDLTKAALKPAAASQKNLALDLRLNTKAACDFADAWLNLAASNTELFFQGKPQQAAEFKKNQPLLASLITFARSVTGADFQVFEENGQRRTTSRLGWKE
jgi:hypothetical protein